MVLIGFLIVIISMYFLQVTWLKRQIECGEESPLHANILVMGVALSRVAKWIGIGLMITGLVLMIIGSHWWSPLYYLAAILISDFAKFLTGNPLLGHWVGGGTFRGFRRFAILIAIISILWVKIGLH